MADWWPVLAIAAGSIATQMWRWLGVALAGRIAPGGGLFEWAGCVAYTLLAALIARLIVFPTGLLADVGLRDRLLATGLALLVYYAVRRSVLAGVTAGATAIALLGTWWP